MTKGILSVETWPTTPDREAEFHRWYDEVSPAVRMDPPPVVMHLLTARSAYDAEDGLRFT